MLYICKKFCAVAIFNTELPKSEFYIPPDYETSPAKRLGLMALGYTQSGENNFLGKAMSWVPFLGVQRNLYAQQMASGDTKKNIKDDFSDNLSKTQIGLGVGKAILSGGTSLAGEAGKFASTDTSKLANPSLIEKQAINSANAAFGIPSTFQGVNPMGPTTNPTTPTVNPTTPTINPVNSTTNFDPSSLLNGDIIGGLAGVLQNKKKREMGKSNIYLNY